MTSRRSIQLPVLNTQRGSSAPNASEILVDGATHDLFFPGLHTLAVEALGQCGLDGGA